MGLVKINFEQGSVVVSIKSLDLATKDLIHIEKFEDFKWLVGNSVVFQLANTYYNISSDVVYYWRAK